MTNGQAKAILRSAAGYNLVGGICIIFLLDRVAPFAQFDPGQNMLFRLFVGGTAVTFGLAYRQAAKTESVREAVLLYGAGLKYWAFAVSLVCYLFFELSAAMLLLFGVSNFVFAVLFTRILLNHRSSASVTRA